MSEDGQEELYKKKLNPEQFRVMRKGGAESAYAGKYWDNDIEGTYLCAACKTPLFLSKDKFDSGTGWPSFYRPIQEAGIEYRNTPDVNGRVSIRCKKCHSNIGNIIVKENYYRVYSVALIFKEKNTLAVLEDTKEALEDVKDQVDQSDDAKIQNPERHVIATFGISSANRYAGWIGGCLMGILIGACAMYFFCNSRPSASLLAVPLLVGTSTPFLMSAYMPSATSSARAPATSARKVPAAPAVTEPPAVAATGTPVSATTSEPQL